MALQHRGLYVCVGLGICIGIALTVFRRTTPDTVSDMDYEEIEVFDEIIPPVENELSLEALRTLVQSPNPSIVSSATHIVVDRFTRMPNAFAILRRDAQSTDPRTKELAIYTIKFLQDWPGLFGRQKPELPPSVVEDNDQPLPAPPILLDPWGGFGFFDNLSDEWTNDTAVTDFGEELPALPNYDPRGWMNINPEEAESPDDSPENSPRIRHRHREAMVLYEGDESPTESDISWPPLQ